MLPPSLADTPRRPDLADVQYVADGSAAHRLDLYLPRAGVGPFPLVIFVHGGAWAFGDKSMVPEAESGHGVLRAVLQAHGYAVASVEYRFSDVARFPAQIHDVKAAVRYLRAHATRYGLDEDRFAVAGDSAGGHLAQLIGFTGGAPALEGDEGVGTVSSSVRAVVSYFGVSDLSAIYSDRSAAGVVSATDPATSYEGRLIGGDPRQGAAHQYALAASPITYAGTSRTPTLLFHGTNDCIVPDIQSGRVYEALRAAGTPAELELIPAGHAEARFFTDPGLQAKLISFLDRYDR